MIQSWRKNHKVRDIWKSTCYDGKQRFGHFLAASKWSLVFSQIPSCQLHCQTLCLIISAPDLRFTEILTKMSHSCEQIWDQSQGNNESVKGEPGQKDVKYGRKRWEIMEWTRSGLEVRRDPVPSLVYISSALPALAKHNTLTLQEFASLRPYTLCLTPAINVGVRKRPHAKTLKESNLPAYMSWTFARSIQPIITVKS